MNTEKTQDKRLLQDAALAVPLARAQRDPAGDALARRWERIDAAPAASPAVGPAWLGLALAPAGAMPGTGLPPTVPGGGAAAETGLLLPAAFQDGGGWQPGPGVESGGRLTSPVSVAGQPAAQVAASVAQQIAVAIGSNAGSTQITLSPEELGTVRLGLVTQDMAITLTILAERPETAELMRRHIDTLAQEFRAMGFQDVRFAFADAGPGSGNARQARASPAADAAGQDPLVDATPSIATAPLRAGTSALDLRL